MLIPFTGNNAARRWRMSSSKLNIARRRQAKQRKRAERLKRRQAQGPSDAPIALVDLLGVEKMSEVRQDFVRPYLGSVTDERSFRALLAIGMGAWNAALLPVERRISAIEDALPHPSISAADRAHARSMVRELIDRKLACFSANRREIAGFDVRATGPGQYYIEVMSTFPA
jgi:hypothetical protein